MQIELYIEGEKKLFSVPYVPMLARRKYYELMAEAEQNKEEPTHKQILKEEDDLHSILSDIVFRNQFTLEQLYLGASKEHVDEKLQEAIFGIKSKKEEDEGNDEGK
ncbi:MAG TPA: hypothetical protein VLA13_11245 [Massilibacterium sp.]|nr:hypothetical protein [Massilibacterium sp.]